MQDCDIKDCDAIVMATHCEYMEIWMRVADKSPWRDTSAKPYRRLRWQQQFYGQSAEVGSVAGLPVRISIMFVRLDGQLVAFVDTVSRINDRHMVRDWLLANAKEGARIEDAMNWQNAVRRDPRD